MKSRIQRDIKMLFIKNKIRTFWGWKLVKNKDTEPQADFPGSYNKKKSVPEIVGFSVESIHSCAIRYNGKNISQFGQVLIYNLLTCPHVST